MKRIARFALFGAVGFGIGGLFSGPISLFGGAIVVLPPGWKPGWLWAVIGFAVWGFGFAVKGALGGTTLGLALRKGRRLTATLALFGAIGFLVGGYLFLLFLVRGGMLPTVSSGVGPLDGALGGAALGLALRDRRKIIGLALAGALGFGIGLVSANYLQHWLEFGGPLLVFIKFSLQFSLGGIIGGASLGAALGYLEKRKAMQDTKS